MLLGLQIIGVLLFMYKTFVLSLNNQSFAMMIRLSMFLAISEGIKRFTFKSQR